MDIQLTGGCYIPEVIFCDDRLSSTEKLLFGRIFGLSGKEGYCWASNEYLGSSVKLHKNNVSTAINKMIKLNLLVSEINTDDQKRIIMRKLYPIINFEAKHEGGFVKTRRGINENTKGGINENTKYSIRDKSIYKLDTKYHVDKSTMVGGDSDVPSNTSKTNIAKTSKNSLTPCTNAELQEVANSLRVSVSAVNSVHASILDLIEAKEFKHKTVYYTLRNWLRMRIEKGTLQVYTNQTYGSNPVPFDPLAD